MEKKDKIKNVSELALILSIFGILLSIVLLVCLIIHSQEHCTYNPTDSKVDVLLEKIEGIKSRFSDLYVWFGFFVTLIIGAFALTWVNAKETARQEAHQAFEEEQKRYKTDLEKIKELRDEAELEIQIIKEFKQLINKPI